MNRIKAQHGGTSAIMLWIIVGVFFGLIGMKSVPVYLNEMKVRRAVANAANDPELTKAPITVIRKKMQKQWDIEDILSPSIKDIKVVRSKGGGRALKYAYEWREPLFLNVSMVHSFADEVPIEGID